MEMGLEFEKMEGSRLNFFSNGSTACLKTARTQPEERMVLSSRRKGATVSNTVASLRRREGRQSEGRLAGCRCLAANNQTQLNGLMIEILTVRIQPCTVFMINIFFSL